MIATLLVYFFLLGVIIGSFLNVVILRHNTGKTVGGRSACMTCRTRLTGRELVPMFSFLIQRGKCRHCSARISWQYPLVELVTGILFVANFYYLHSMSGLSVQTFVSFALSSAILALFVAIFVYDLRHKIIPDVFSFSVFGLSVVYVLLNIFVFGGVGGGVVESVIPVKTGIQDWAPAFAGVTTGLTGVTTGAAGVTTASGVTGITILNLFAGIIFFLVIYLLWKFSSGRLVGLGDAKLLLTIGTMLGFVYGLSAIFIAVWIAMAFVIASLLKDFLGRRTGRITMKSEIAFGPFLILGFVIVYFAQIDVTNLSILLNTN